MTTSPDTVPAAASARTATILLLGIIASVGAWMVHISALASLVELSRRSGGAVALMDALTVVTAAICVAVIILGIRALRRCDRPEGDASPIGRTAFLALLAIILGATNLLLILFEGSYVHLIDRHA
jgi:hypothetical protein